MIAFPPRPHLCPILQNTPGSFPALMDLYECNYMNMRRLLPIMPKNPGHWVSRVPGSLDLHLCLIERFRYTSEWHLTYQFLQPEGTVVAEPALHIRVYHDARLAEVLTAQRRRSAAFPTESLLQVDTQGPQLYSRWKINRFLFKWLNYCLRQGHRFNSPSEQLTHPQHHYP